MSQINCPYLVGERVRFTPSERTRGLCQSIEDLGIKPGEIQPITEIRDGTYLYFANGSGGWPWNEFSAAD